MTNAGTQAPAHGRQGSASCQVPPLHHHPAPCDTGDTPRPHHHQGQREAHSGTLHARSTASTATPSTGCTPSPQAPRTACRHREGPDATPAPRPLTLGRAPHPPSTPPPQGTDPHTPPNHPDTPHPTRGTPHPPQGGEEGEGVPHHPPRGGEGTHHGIHQRKLANINDRMETNTRNREG